MADYTTWLTTKTQLVVSQYRHYYGDAVDIYLIPHPAPDNDLRAIITGTIKHAGYGEDWTYGISVTIEGDGDYAGYFVRYAHLSAVYVTANTHVELGDFLGYEGTTGRTYGQHVHLETYINGVPTTDEQLVALLGFPILPTGVVLNVEFGGPEPPPPPPPPPGKIKNKPWLYSRRGNINNGFRF